MDKDKELLIKAIEDEIERVEYHMYNVLGLDRDKIEELYRQVEVELEKLIKNQFENLAEIKHGEWCL